MKQFSEKSRRGLIIALLCMAYVLAAECMFYWDALHAFHDEHARTDIGSDSDERSNYAIASFLGYVFALPSTIRRLIDDLRNSPRRWTSIALAIVSFALIASCYPVGRYIHHRIINTHRFMF